MLLDIFNRLKFFISKINIILRYKKSKISHIIKWIFFGKEISNFVYEIENQEEIIEIVNVITGIKFEKLNAILKEIDPKNEDFRSFFSENYFKDFSNKIIFGRRMIWYLIVRVMKPTIVIESGVERALGSGLLIYALYMNHKEDNIENEFIGIDIKEIKKPYFNFENKKYLNYKFNTNDSIDFIKNFNRKSKIVYISDAEHNYDFELEEYTEIQLKMLEGSIIISDNNSGALSEFSRKHNKNMLIFKESPKNTWYNGATASISYFY